MHKKTAKQRRFFYELKGVTFKSGEIRYPMHSIKTFKAFLVTLAIVAMSIPLQAGDIVYSDNVKFNTIILPRVYKPLETKSAISISFVHLPLDWVETSIDAPLVQLSSKLGLPAGFSLEGSFQTIYVSNQFRIGPHWNIEVGKFSLATGIDAGFLFGKMDIAGFNNKANGLMLYPTISLGFHTNDLAFTISAERNTIQSLKISSGDAEISDFKNFKSGQTISLFLEQKLWRRHVLVLGLMNNFQKFYFPAWPAFSAFNKRYYIPQIYLGLVL